MLATLLLGAAFAWSPAAHRDMAARAVVLEAAAPGAPSPAEAAAFARAAAGEDLHLARKWAQWHHYWFPERLGVRRPSEERVETLVPRVLAAEGVEAWRLAGLLVHHVQDMASPPHVIPLHHGLADGFEDVDVTGPIAASVAAPPDVPVEALQADLVARTRAALEAPLRCDGVTLVPTRDLWVPAPDGFGTRGPVRFGDLPACEAAFAAFAAARVDDAVASSRAVVRWVAGLAADEPAYVSTSTRTPIDPPR